MIINKTVTSSSLFMREIPMMAAQRPADNPRRASALCERGNRFGRDSDQSGDGFIGLLCRIHVFWSLPFLALARFGSPFDSL